jgi:hypothetical protein
MRLFAFTCIHASMLIVALGDVDPLFASAPSPASLASVHATTLGALADDEISLSLYTLSGRSGNDSFSYETATT